jgi:hypothetical protein
MNSAGICWPPPPKALVLPVVDIFTKLNICVVFLNREIINRLFFSELQNYKDFRFKLRKLKSKKGKDMSKLVNLIFDQIILVN